LSAHKRPWYPWYPSHYITDEKVRGLGWNADLIYRRILDLMWAATDCQVLNDVDYLHQAVAIALAKEEFCSAWKQIQRKDFEIFKEKDGKLYNKRLMLEFDKTVRLSKIRAKLGKRGGQAKGKQ